MRSGTGHAPSKTTMMIRTLMCALLVFAVAGATFAQSTTATLRGKITDTGGQPLADVEINAVSPTTGFVHTVRSGRDGSYVLAGLTPGAYNIVVAAAGREPLSQNLEVRVGQTVDVDFALGTTLVVSEAITVTGQAIDTRATEIGTNISPQEMDALPQNERNFLNFAGLAPGIAVSNNVEKKRFSAAGQPADQVNVFIDGVSFKNDVLEGGIVGQESSRGNPFPQNAVQEFRVLTQNYSAQYDHAATAVITAITKSGTNAFDGEAFVFYQPKDWVTEAPKGFNFPTTTTNPGYHRYQYGLSLGGPIVKDRLHYFGSWEGTDEHAIQTVRPGTPPPGSTLNAAQYAGTFGSPFRSNLLFGKTSWQPAAPHLFDFSGSYRREKDTRGFGGQTAFEAGERIDNWVYNLTGRHQWTASSSLNQLALSWQQYGWNPTAINTDTVGLNYFGVIRIGGKDTTQRFEQRRIELRDDFTYSGLKWAGQHTLQFGGNIDFMNYEISKCLSCNPVFNFRQDVSFTIPFEAFLGIGDPNLSIDNSEYGIYAQDSWVVNDHLNLNLGLRWDYESNMIDADYVTPANIRQALTGRVPAEYLSTGSEREPYTGAWQPRLGFAYDLFANSRSVIFGGWGRYYDRLFLNASLDERFRLQFPRYQFFFSATGAPFEGHPTIRWDPKYLTRAGLEELIAQGATRPEVFLLSNETKPPFSNQWNLGYRQSFGPWVASASYNVVRGHRGFTWIWGGGRCCLTTPTTGATLISSSTKEYWYDAIYATVDRPYTSQSRWGVRLAWTHADAEQTGNDLFSLDYPTPADFPRHTVPGTERDRVVVSGTFGLPGDARLSTIISLGSGQAYAAHNFAQNRLFIGTVYPEKTSGFASRNFDLRLEKSVGLGPVSLGVSADAFNVLNHYEPGCLEINTSAANFGQSFCVANLGRRYQVGLKVGF